MTLKPDMTPDDHAAHAEELLEQARPYAFSAPARASLERQAIAHAVLSSRTPPKPARKPAPKKTTRPKPEKKENEE